MEIEVAWSVLAPNDTRWDRNRCLYAYVHPRTSTILYIGKAYQKSVAHRMTGPHKEVVFAGLRDRCGVGEGEIVVLYGHVSTEPGRRVTKPVLQDVESLLIRRLQPAGNKRCRESRIERPGMWVTCFGDWPHRRNRFRDVHPGET